MKPTSGQFKNNAGSGGVTLIELLIVVSIVVVLTAVLIPRLRIVNRERAIREAARTVASLFVSARERAIDEGIAGVLIERNTNFVDPDTGVLFAGTRLLLMRTLPPYSGDDIGSRARIIAPDPTQPLTMQVQIPEPLAQNGSEPPIVQVNDQISLNLSSVRYRISGVSPQAGSLNLIVDLAGGALPALPITATSAPGIPFLIFRQPEPVESSRVDLPPGFMVDLRFSGPLAVGPQALTPLGSMPAGQSQPIGTLFNQPPLPADPPEPDGIRFFFNDSGTLDRLDFLGIDTQNNPATIQPRVPFTPVDSLFLLIAAIETDTLINPILQDSNLWVTMNRSSGAVNVASNSPPLQGERAGLDAIQTVVRAREIAINQQSANQ